MALNESEYRLAESLAAFGSGHRGEEFFPAQLLHPAQGPLNRPPIGNGLLEPVVLLLGQRHTHGLAFDFAGPRIAGASRPRSAILDVAFTDPADVRQLFAQPGVLDLAGLRGGGGGGGHE